MQTLDFENFLYVAESCFSYSWWNYSKPRLNTKGPSFQYSENNLLSWLFDGYRQMTDSDFMSKVQFSLNYLLKLVSHRETSDEICFLRWSFPFFIVICYLVFSNSNWVIRFSTGSVPNNSKMPRTAWITLHWFLVLNLTQPLVSLDVSFAG